MRYAGWASPNGQVMVESSDKTWSTGEGNGKSLQYSCLENPMNNKKRQKDIENIRYEEKILMWAIQKGFMFRVCVYICVFVYSTLVVKNLPANAIERCWRPGFIFWVKKIPWSRAWQPTPVFLPRKCHGQRSLAGSGP